MLPPMLQRHPGAGRCQRAAVNRFRGLIFAEDYLVAGEMPLCMVCASLCHEGRTPPPIPLTGFRMAFSRITMHNHAHCIRPGTIRRKRTKSRGNFKGNMAGDQAAVGLAGRSGLTGMKKASAGPMEEPKIRPSDGNCETTPAVPKLSIASTPHERGRRWRSVLPETAGKVERKEESPRMRGKFRPTTGPLASMELPPHTRESNENAASDGIAPSECEFPLFKSLHRRRCRSGARGRELFVIKPHAVAPAIYVPEPGHRRPSFLIRC